MKNRRLTALILCLTMLFSITSGIFSAAFASDSTTGSAYSLDTTTGSAISESGLWDSTTKSAYQLEDEEDAEGKHNTSQSASSLKSFKMSKAVTTESSVTVTEISATMDFSSLYGTYIETAENKTLAITVESLEIYGEITDYTAVPMAFVSGAQDIKVNVTSKLTFEVARSTDKYVLYRYHYTGDDETFKAASVKYPYIPGQYLTEVEEDDEEEEIPSVETTVDGKEFSVSGALPEGVDRLEVTPFEEENLEDLNRELFDVKDLPEGYFGMAYDISLMSGDTKVQPDGSVVVKVPVDTVNYNDFGVLHILESGSERYEIIDDIRVGKDYIEFVTTSFSTFYILSGMQNDDASNGDVYYIFPGVEIELGTFELSSVICTEQSHNSTSCVCNVNIEKYTYLGAFNGVRFETNAFSKYGVYTLKSKDKFLTPSKTVTIHILTPEQMLELSVVKNSPVYVTILNDSSEIPDALVPDIDENILTTVNYNANADNRYTFSAYSSGNTTLDDASSFLNFSTIAQQFSMSQEGLNVGGIIDSEKGIDTLPCVYFSEWDILLEEFVKEISPRVVAANGDTVTLNANSDLSQYKLYPYVIKYIGEATVGSVWDRLLGAILNNLSSYDVGWHVECCIVSDETYSLSYYNSLDGLTLLNDENGVFSVVMPQQQLLAPGQQTNVGEMYKKNLSDGASTKIEVEKTSIYVKDTSGLEYTKVFLGWSTSKGSNVVAYKPGDLITITENTTLYAVWKTSGTITIGIKGCSNSDTHQTFLFNISGPNNFSLDIIVHENSSVTINNLTPGTYTVKEKIIGNSINSWSWRYGNVEQQQKTLVEKDSLSFIFDYTGKRSNFLWLDSNAWRDYFNNTSSGSPTPMIISLAFVDIVLRENESYHEDLKIRLA